MKASRARHHEWSVKRMICKTYTKCVPNEAATTMVAAFFSSCFCVNDFVCESAMIKSDVTGV